MNTNVFHYEFQAFPSLFFSNPAEILPDDLDIWHNLSKVSLVSSGDQSNLSLLSC